MAGAPVFEMDTRIQTKKPVPEAGKDDHIPIEGSVADWPSITTNAFVAGPKPGQDQSLIRTGDLASKVEIGQSLAEIKKKKWTHVYSDDEVRELDQNRKTQINKNEDVTVIGDRTVKVTQNIKETAGQNIDITAGVTLTLKGPGGQIRIDAGGVTIQGTLVKINC